MAYQYREKKIWDSPSGVVMWQVVSYLSLDPDEMLSQAGPAEEWFVDEDPNQNPGANYIMGMLDIFYSHGAGRYFLNLSDQEMIDIDSAVKDISELSSRKYRCSRGDLMGVEWERLRLLLRRLLDKLGVWVNPPKKPFWMLDYTDLDFMLLKEWRAERLRRKNWRVGKWRK